MQEALLRVHLDKGVLLTVSVWLTVPSGILRTLSGMVFVSGIPARPAASCPNTPCSSFFAMYLTLEATSMSAFPVGEGSRHSSPFSAFLVEALDGVVGAYSTPVFAGKLRVYQPSRCSCRE
mgnify:FL=1